MRTVFAEFNKAIKEAPVILEDPIDNVHASTTYPEPGATVKTKFAPSFTLLLVPDVISADPDFALDNVPFVPIVHVAVCGVAALNVTPAVISSVI